VAALGSRTHLPGVKRRPSVLDEVTDSQISGIDRIPRRAVTGQLLPGIHRWYLTLSVQTSTPGLGADVYSEG